MGVLADSRSDGKRVLRGNSRLEQEKIPTADSREILRGAMF